jgi:hypothetical protein
MPDQPANKTEQLVQFRMRDAQRINNAVLAHESARRGRSPSKLPRAFGGGGGGIDQVFFLGAWPKDTYKQVFYASDTTNTSTASALNVLCSILPTVGYRRAIVSSDGDVLLLLNSQCAGP